MYIHNTTFIVDRNIVSTFLEWAHNIFAKAANESGRFKTVTIARILTQTDPDTVNFAIQMTTASLESTHAWEKDVAIFLKDDLATRLGSQHVMFFSTDMEVIE